MANSVGSKLAAVCAVAFMIAIFVDIAASAPSESIAIASNSDQLAGQPHAGIGLSKTCRYNLAIHSLCYVACIYLSRSALSLMFHF